MRQPRFIVVTGKGGVGKTVVAAALGLSAARRGHHSLIIETASDGSLARLFGRSTLGPAPSRLQAELDAVHVDARDLVEQYFARLLRFRWLSDRLLSSNTFNALTAAAPGVTEFLLLERVLQWLEPGLTGRHQRYEVVIVDAPATGHVIKLLGTPRRLAAMVAAGPLGATARRLLELLADHNRTHVVLVSLPEDMVVRETIEAYRTLRGDLGLHVCRPVLNRVFPSRFTPEDGQRIAASPDAHPIVEAARFTLAGHREAERTAAQLRRALDEPPVELPQLFGDELGAADLGPFAEVLGPVVLDHAPRRTTTRRTGGTRRGARS